jgi:S-adenosylmethionine synthetase
MRSARVLSPGHPDRACDIIAETIVDEYVRRDPTASIRVRVCGGRGALFVAGIASSTADFDVGAVVTRTAASLGVRNHVEPFVSIEQVPGSYILEATRTHRPISVAGYAVRETDVRLPKTVVLAKRIAKHLEDLRSHDAEWFWLEPAFEVTVIDRPHADPVAYVACAHGEHPLAETRQRIAEAISKIEPNVAVRVNLHGSIRANGLDQDIGASGVHDEPYGSGIIIPGSTIGCDPSNPVKFGTWLARGLAKRALGRSLSSADPAKNHIDAVLVRATYAPGDREPSFLSIRDDRGRDVSEPADAATMAYAYLHPNLRLALSTNAAHWGFAGEVEMPWEGEKS